MGFDRSEPNPSLKSNQIQTKPTNQIQTKSNQTHEPNQTKPINQINPGRRRRHCFGQCCDVRTRQGNLGFKPDEVFLASRNGKYEETRSSNFAPQTRWAILTNLKFTVALMSLIRRQFWQNSTDFGDFSTLTISLQMLFTSSSAHFLRNPKITNRIRLINYPNLSICNELVKI